MKYLALPFNLLFGLFGRHAWLSAGICTALAVISAVLGWGDVLALFACTASGIVIWKDEHDHPQPMVEMGDGTAA